MAAWTDSHHERLVAVYVWILAEQEAGRATDKRALLERLEGEGMGKKRQNMEAYCQQYSEVLYGRGLHYVTGWLPTSLCARSSPSAAQRERMWRILRDELARQGLHH